MDTALADYAVCEGDVSCLLCQIAFSGLRAIGCGLPVSFFGSILINLLLTFPTQQVTLATTSLHSADAWFLSEI